MRWLSHGKMRIRSMPVGNTAQVLSGYLDGAFENKKEINISFRDK